MKDFHIHSIFSFDSSCPIETYIDFAEKYNYDSICFTEHDEILNSTNTLQNFIDIIKKSSKSSKINIYSGIEIEITKVQNLDEMAYHIFDFILASFHQNSKNPIDYYINLLNLLSFDEIFNKFDCLAHIDFPIRYNNFANLFFEKFSEISFFYMDKILQKLAINKKALEINLVNFLHNKKDISLCFWKEVIKIFKKYDGEFFTIGSDSHSIDDFINTTKIRNQIIKELQLDEYDFVIYRNHKVLKSS